MFSNVKVVACKVRISTLGSWYRIGLALLKREESFFDNPMEKLIVNKRIRKEYYSTVIYAYLAIALAFFPLTSVQYRWVVKANSHYESLIDLVHYTSASSAQISIEMRTEYERSVRGYRERDLGA